MTTVRTDLRNTRDDAARLRFAPSSVVPETNVQDAIDSNGAAIADLEKGDAITEITAAGDVQVTNEYGVWLINKAVGAATVVNLDRASTFTHKVQIKDKKLDGATNNITITPHSDDVNGIDGMASVTIATDGGGFTLIPTTLGWSLG
jgi:hypothetical protein